MGRDMAREHTVDDLEEGEAVMKYKDSNEVKEGGRLVPFFRYKAFLIFEYFFLSFFIF